MVGADFSTTSFGTVVATDRLPLVLGTGLDSNASQYAFGDRRTNLNLITRYLVKPPS
jgi:hypothetical protein